MDLMKKIEKQIFEEIKKAKMVLMHLHLGPDGDSIGSVLAMWQWLKKLGKKVTVISFDPIPEEYFFLKELKKVKKANVAKMDLSKYDLWLSLDASDWDMITKNKDFQPPRNLMLINIDHHPTNTKYGKINLVLVGKSSLGEILFDLFEKWQVKIDEKMAHLLFLSIFTDTKGYFYRNTTPATMRVGAKLLELGANREKIVFDLYNSQRLKTLKYWAKVLESMKIDRKKRFVIARLAYRDYEELGLRKQGAKGAASNFLPIVKGTDFGVLLTEDYPGEVRGSMRSRTDFDVAKIAVAMGGGGHKAAAGFRMKGDLKSVEKKLLAVIDKLTETKKRKAQSVKRKTTT